ncbi:hypothetical protein KEJ39_00425 [Candidatus Bathyarchaeota archaeon]|nr:hypothetical protein [Candidatus Bathyarchaeota archaeon]
MQIVRGLRKSMKRWRKVEVAQTFLSAIIILAILSLASYYAFPSVFRQTSSEAVKLVLNVFSPESVAVGRPQVVRVYAANAEGNIDRSRDDTVELKLDPPTSSTRLSVTRVTLVGGEATFTVISSRSEVVTLTATWIQGKSPLRAASATINFLHGW